MGFGEISTTWNEIFGAISPLMIDEESETRLARAINEFINRKCKELQIIDDTKKGYIYLVKAVSKDSFLIILVQLKALGLIKKSVKKRSLTDAATYWTLTPYGENLMTKLIAIKK